METGRAQPNLVACRCLSRPAVQRTRWPLSSRGCHVAATVDALSGGSASSGPLVVLHKFVGVRALLRRVRCPTWRRRPQPARGPCRPQLERATGASPPPRSPGWTSGCPGTAQCRPNSGPGSGLVAQAGIAAFVEWYRDPERRGPTITADVFGTAPRELARAVTLQQTVEMVRVTIEVRRGERTDGRRTAATSPGPRRRVLRYSREVAFAAAQVYAQAAEARGAWDARLEALVVDALLRGEADEAVRSRAAALGWGPAGRRRGRRHAARGDRSRRRRIATGPRHAGHDVLAGVQGDRLVASSAAVGDPDAGRLPVLVSSARPVVVGAVGPRPARGRSSAAPAVAGLRAAAAWPDARARSPPTTCCPSAPSPGRPSPTARTRGGGLRARSRGRPAAAGDAGHLPRAAAVPGGHRPRCCSFTPTPCATGSVVSPTSSGRPHGSARHAYTLAARRWRWAGCPDDLPERNRGICEDPTTYRQRTS